MVFCFCLFGSSTQDRHMSNSSLCDFNIINEDEVKRQFEDYSKIDNVWLIFFDISLSPKTFKNESGLDTQHMNGLTRWIWVSRKHSNLLTYPVDFDVITFQISKNVEKTISVFANVSFIFEQRNLQNYFICIESLYGNIFKTVLNGNKTDWLYCNRYFKGQDYKYILFMFTGSWLGFDFACFDSFHQTVASAIYIKKGTVNVIINIFIIVLCMYLPLFFLLLPNRYNADQSNVRFYRKGDYPNSFARLLFRLHDIPKQPKKDIDSVEDWWSQYDITMFKPEIHISSCVYIITLATFFFEDHYIKQVIPDYTFFPETFHSLTSKVKNIQTNLFLLTLSYMLTIPFFIMAISYFSQMNSELYSINPFGCIKIKDVWQNVEKEEEIYFGYTKFALKFLHRISLFFSLDLWATIFTFPCKGDGYLSNMCNIVTVCFAFILNFCLYFLFLMVPGIYFVLEWFVCLPFKIIYLSFKNSKNYCDYAFACFAAPLVIICFGIGLAYMFIGFQPYFLNVIQFIFRSLIYVIFVAGPLFANISDTAYSFWVIVLSICIYLAKYTTSFHTNYKKLLNVLLQINKEHFSDQQLREEPKHANGSVNSDAKPEGIYVDYFDTIAEKYLPLRHQIFYFFLKITLTSLFLYITFDSINQGGSDKFTTSLLPNILTAAIPALAEKFCSPFNIDDTLNFHAEEIKSDYLDEIQKPPPIPATGSIASTCNKRLMLFAPFLYSLKVFISFILKSIFKRPSPVEARQCPTTCSICCIKNNNEKKPLNPQSSP